jgi:hypothetical protein
VEGLWSQVVQDWVANSQEAPGTAQWVGITSAAAKAGTRRRVSFHASRMDMCPLYTTVDCWIAVVPLVSWQEHGQVRWGPTWCPSHPAWAVREPIDHAVAIHLQPK